MNRKEKLEEDFRVYAYLGDLDKVEEFINLGVDVNSRDPSNGRTALIFACEMNRQDVITKLLENGADQNIFSNTGETPQSVCTNPQIVQMLRRTSQPNPNDLILKVRLANTQDTDFIEIDLPRTCFTFQDLLQICCRELNIEEGKVAKLRKLPNTRIRRDKDVERLENFQEIEVVTECSIDDVNSPTSNGAAMPLTASNNYQSISNKDQTILY